MFAETSFGVMLVLLTLGFVLGVMLGTLFQKRRIWELEKTCNYDRLTGLRKSHDLEAQVLQRLNKKEKRINGLSATRTPKHSGAVVFLDIDGFKKANDCLGHEAGNKILQILAKIVVRNLRGDNDLAIRYSSSTAGDEFVLLFVGATVEDARIAMIAMRQQFEEATAWAFPSLQGKVSFSFGAEKVRATDKAASISRSVGIAEQRTIKEKQQRKMER